MRTICFTYKNKTTDGFSMTLQLTDSGSGELRVTADGPNIKYSELYGQLYWVNEFIENYCLYYGKDRYSFDFKDDTVIIKLFSSKKADAQEYNFEKIRKNISYCLGSLFHNND